MAPHNPFFSIVIPTYNRALFISKAIDSVLLQREQDFEIIVVDDGSTDNTEEIVRRLYHKDNIRYYRKANEERAAARNFGARHAQGVYVNFLDSDDVLYPNHLEVARAICEQNEDIPLFHLGFDVKDENGNLLRAMDPIGSINGQIVRGNMLSANGVFIKTEILLANPFNEDRALSSLEDWELWIRLSSRFLFFCDDTITSTVIQHDNRSVMNTMHQKIKDKVNCFVRYMQLDEKNNSYFGKNLKLAAGSAYTYGALHLAIAGENRWEVVRYLLKGITASPGEIFKRRFLVILRKLLSL